MTAGTGETVVATSETRKHGYPGDVLADYEIIQLPIDKFISVQQVRKGRNSVADDLKDDIEDNGLISQPHVARMSRDMLDEYIGFVNRTWGGDTHVDEFADQRHEDGWYYLVVAGHSRVAAVSELVAEGKFDPSVRIASNIHKVSSPREIIDIQVGENIHSTPSLERVAMVIVEQYEWGCEQGSWRDIDEYLRVTQKKSDRRVSGVLAFTNLPQDVRRYVLMGHMPYTAGLEIGRAAPTVRQHILYKMSITEEDLAFDELLAQQVAGLVGDRLFVEAQRVIASRTNSTAAPKMVKAWHKSLFEEMAVGTGQMDEEDTLFGSFELATPEEQLKAMQRETRLAAEAIMREYSHLPLDTALKVMEIGAPRIKPGFVDKLIEEFRESAGQAAGELALAQTVAMSE